MVSQLALFFFAAGAAPAAYGQSAEIGSGGGGGGGGGEGADQHRLPLTQVDAWVDAAGHASHQLSPRGAGDMLSVLDFGAKANGRTDDSAAVQRAVDAAQTQNLPLLLPAGTYLLTSSVTIRADVKPKVAAMSGSSQRAARRAARRQLASARFTYSATQVYSPLRMLGDGIEQSILVAGAPMAAVLSLPNISQFIDFSHFGIDCNKSADIGIDAPNTLIRSRFASVGVNNSKTAGIRAAGWINRFEDLSLRANGIGLWLSAAPAADQIWNNQVDVVNSNFEWNDVGIAIDAGDSILIQGNDLEGHGGPALIAAGVWGLTYSSNYHEANNLKLPLYGFGLRAAPVVGDVILAGANTRLPRNSAPDAPWVRSTCKVRNGSLDRSDPPNCTTPTITGRGIQCEGAVITGNTFVWGQEKKVAALPACIASPQACHYSAVVLAGARGVTIRGNEINGAGALILGPPADKSVWMAEDVQFGSNARFAPEVYLLPLNSSGGGMAKELQAQQVGCTSCDALSYASFESPDILHRNFGWLPTQGRPFGPGHLTCENSQGFDGKATCVWQAKEADLDLSLAGSSGAGVELNRAPTLAGQAVYAAIRVKPMQNATELELVLGDARARCNTVADVWTHCVVSTVLGEGGVARVSVHAASAGGWALSNLVLARVGASLNLLG